MDDDSVHSLLAKGRLSGPQRDRILERVLDEHASPRRSRRWWVALAAAVPAAAVLAVVISSRRAAHDPEKSEWLVPKGALDGATLTASCAGRAPGECHPGDRLVFEVTGARHAGFFAAYAECGSRERIWYFPNASGEMPTVAASQERWVLPVAARIGAEHGLGRCVVHLLLLEKSSEREAIATGRARPLAKAEAAVAVEP